MNRYIRIAAILFIVSANIGCDQISKAVVRENLQYHEQIEVINDNFILTKVENTGAFLGLGENLPQIVKNIILSFIPALTILALLVFVLTKTSLSHLAVFGLCSVVGGGIGNIFDRIAHGSVTDFLHIDLGYLQTGVFNMADVSIMMGMMVLLWGFWREGGNSAV
jgi:signal peptidase II